MVRSLLTIVALAVFGTVHGAEILGFELRACSKDNRFCVRLSAERAFRGNLSSLTVFDRAQVEIRDGRTSRLWRGGAGQYDPDADTLVLKDVSGGPGKDMVIFVAKGQTLWL